MLTYQMTKFIGIYISVCSHFISIILRSLRRETSCVSILAANDEPCELRQCKFFILPLTSMILDSRCSIVGWKLWNVGKINLAYLKRTMWNSGIYPRISRSHIVLSYTIYSLSFAPTANYIAVFFRVVLLCAPVCMLHLSLSNGMRNILLRVVKIWCICIHLCTLCKV